VNEPAVRAIFDEQRLASRHQAAPTSSQRLQSLDKLRDLVQSHGAAIAQAICEDYGARSVAETELLEIVPTLNAIRHARRKLSSLDEAAATAGGPDLSAPGADWQVS
jgi:coniferyl-aldehyde dehydrogenase